MIDMGLRRSSQTVGGLHHSGGARRAHVIFRVRHFGHFELELGMSHSELGVQIQTYVRDARREIGSRKEFEESEEARRRASVASTWNYRTSRSRDPLTTLVPSIPLHLQARVPYGLTQGALRSR